MHEVYTWTKKQILMNYASIEVLREDEKKEAERRSK
jgi:hypothetical protein